MKRVRAQAGIAQFTRERHDLGADGRHALNPADTDLKHGGRVQRADPPRRRFRAGLQGLGQPAKSLGVQPACHPRPPRRDRDRQGPVGHLAQRRRQRGPQIPALDTEPGTRLADHAATGIGIKGLSLAGEPQGMPAAVVGKFPGRGQLPGRVLPDDLEQPEAGLVARPCPRRPGTCPPAVT